MLFNQLWELKAGVSAPAIISNTRNRWFISDTHFFHEKVLTFKDDAGKLIRGDKFSCVEEMNEIMVERWNARIKPGDKVWHLGDVVLGVEGKDYKTIVHTLLNRLNGHKDLVIGNHDKIKNAILHNHFHRMELWKVYNHSDQQAPFTLSHIPLRIDQMRGGSCINVHGHIHQNMIEDPRYINVCVEHTNYAPVHIDEIYEIARQRGLI